MNASFFTGGNILHGQLGAPDAGWFGYAPLTLSRFSPGEGVDFWALGLLILGVASMASGFNFIVTILNMRAPGMTLFRMPLFVWMTLVTSFLIVFAMPVITVALFELLFDRLFDANFFNVEKGGTPLLWQHMFWLFGHPEVYILILPAMGIVSEVLPTFARKPLFGYPFVVFSGIAIAFMSWGVWAHHMYTTGLGAIANSAFGVSTILIAIPTGVKIFNWLATLWGGSINLKTPLYFAIGFIAMFTIGGLTGVTHSIVPSDYQQQDTYYIVAHFHQVLFGGAIFGLFAGIYYWYPKFTGKMLYEGLGQLQFWLMFIGFNVTFQPMMILGLIGMPRRIYSYPEGQGFDTWNLVATVGAFMIATSVLLFIINVIATARRKERAEADPWDGRTLEWSLPSPVPPYNFEEIPTVHALDDFWHQKYAEDERGRPVPVVAGGSGSGGGTARRRPRHPYALAFVLPPDHRAGPAHHRYRPDIRPRHRGGGRGGPGGRHLRLGAGARVRVAEEGERVAALTGPGDEHRPRQPQAPDVAVPRFGVPLLRIADRRLSPLPRQERDGAVPGGPVRHSVHVGQRLHPADEQRDDGAGAGGDPAGRSARPAHLAAHDGVHGHTVRQRPGV